MSDSPPRSTFIPQFMASDLKLWSEMKILKITNIANFYDAVAF